MLLRTTCSRDCPDACGLLVDVVDGRVGSCRGDPAHPVTRGFLCSQGRDYPKRVNAPDRLLFPMKRTAAGWERLSWDSALDAIADQLVTTRAETGPLGVLDLRYSGMRGRVAKAMSRFFWAHFGGATTAVGGMCVESIDAAQSRDFGPHVRAAHPPEDILHSRAIVLWGRNPAVTRQHLVPLLDQARKGGAALTVIDPVRTATARRADTHLALRPGSDRFLALAVGRRLIEWDRLDHAFVRDHVSGFPAYRDCCMRHAIDELARLTDLTVSQIDALARVYADVHPVSTFVGLGAGSWAHGGNTVRAIDALVAISGNLGVAGGGANADIEDVAGLDDTDPGWPAAGLSRTLRRPMLAEEIAGAEAPPLRMAWIAGANPVAMTPHPGRVARALRSLRFVVVVEQFMTATAQLADIVLPVSTCFETDDLVTSYGHDYLGVCQRVVEPPGECRSDGEILQALATRLGFGEALAGSPDDWMRRLLRPLCAHGVSLEALRRGAVRNPRAPRVPLSDMHFATPSGRFELLDAVAPPRDLRAGELYLLATKTGRMINAQVLREDLPEAPCAKVHPSTLQALGLVQGARARIESAAGALAASMRVDDALRPDVVLLQPAIWEGDARGVNQLRELILADCGDCAAMHETRVTLHPV